jgi:diketogulonate reductase-like aldo/keto reductase
LFADGTVRREDLFVTTKLWNNNHRPERVKPALQASLNRRGRSVSGAHPVRVQARR